MNQPNPYSPPGAALEDVPVRPSVAIDGLPVSESWKAKFHLIEKAGGVKMTAFKALSFGERMKCSFNVLAFLFGPIYYAVKGMWKKGLAMFGAGVVAIVVLSVVMELLGMGRMANALGYGVSAVFGMRANIDYYKKMVLGDNGWW